MYNHDLFKAWKRWTIECNIIKGVRNLIRLKKEIEDTTIKNIRNLFRLKKEIKQAKAE